MRSVDRGWVNMLAYYFFASGPKFTNFLLNVVGAVVDHLLFQFTIFQSILKIFAIKVQSCPTARWILEAFCLPNFRGAGPRDVVPKLSCLPRSTKHGKVCDVTALRLLTLAPKLYACILHTLNFKPVFECLFLKIVGDPHPQGALARLGHSPAHVKNLILQRS